tara:strand:+ start:64 stop:825 length:762 start_codon:yes stop_codon:yes gene_type:complete
MKNLLYLGIILMLASCGSNEEEIKEEERYDVSETVNPTDTLMSLKADMKPLNGIVYCKFGDIGKYVDGKKEGVQKLWYDDGQLYSEKNYKDGKKEGIQKVWFENGQLWSEKNYKDGKAEGIQKVWYENGQLGSERNLKDGKLINQYSSSTIKIGNLEVMTEDLVDMTEDLGDMTWDDAKKACADLGGGWRLPTKDELNVLYENKDKIGGFAYDYYWSSTEYGNSSAWLQFFGGGGQLYYNKSSNYYVRSVRAF